MNKSILFLGKEKDHAELYKRLIKEKYVVVLFSAFNDDAQIFLKRIEELTEDDRKRAVLLISDLKYKESDTEWFCDLSMAHSIINFIEHGEFCVVVYAKSATEVPLGLKGRLTTVANQNIVVKILQHYHEYKEY